MKPEPTDEIYLAAQAEGCGSVVLLGKLILRYASEYRKSRSPDAAYFAGRAYYEMPLPFPGRSRKARAWLERSVAGRPQDVFSYHLLGCLAFDERKYLPATMALERIAPKAFAELNPYWKWRDTKVLELRCAAAIHMNDLERLASAAAAYSEVVCAADEEDIPAPHELVAALSSEESLQANPALMRSLARHLEIGWGDTLGRELTRLANVGHEAQKSDTS